MSKVTKKGNENGQLLFEFKEKQPLQTLEWEAGVASQTY